MNYENFKDVTLCHRVVPVNWPVTFKPPSKLTVLELHTFHDALYGDDPPALFRKLTNEEWAASEQDIANGTSNYLVPPFRNNTSPMPTPLLLTDSATASPASDALTSPDDIPSHDTPSEPASSSAGVQGTEDTSSLTQPPDDTSVPSPPEPGPRGGAIISFDGATKGKGKKKAVGKKKTGKEGGKAAKTMAQADVAAKKSSAAAKKGSKSRAKKGGKKGGVAEVPNVSEGNSNSNVSV